VDAGKPFLRRNTGVVLFGARDNHVQKVGYSVELSAAVALEQTVKDSVSATEDRP